ncbi:MULTISPECIES: DinB family protein [Acidobacterium]|uniref:DinB family protein n=1 Tax=Acidobacterium capsulatum (strain ATCC 51196 / DSM 11244 / BCRC 80197 / JCM 7670 / NBRC 15755 / NCIMB 13165 / 161) TaxID=240015 RepID=C1F8D4_ACIC5|nr:MULTISPECIES: DinB family protein [Acidobacterium]ACO34383.1 DinB family protein [Acidobacterium capsulatum ATCC 51196]HCT59818.1 DinB family protein [Acidobacterium sp.]
MSIAQSMLAEFEIQAPITRKFLGRLPEDKLAWQPHPKSMTAGQLALHLAGVPGGVIRAAQNDSMQAAGFQFPQPTSLAAVLAAFDESIALVRELLPPLDDRAMHATWRLISGEEELLAIPRQEFLRDILFSHWYQHRGQFGVYLRLLDIPVPATWGPSADEPPVFPQRTTA